MSRHSFRRIRVVFLAAVLGAFVLPAPSQAEMPSGLQKADPITCSGQRAITLRGRAIETTGNAVVASGNCAVQIVDSYIVAGGVGILVQGNAQVVVAESYVEGGLAALVAEGRGQIRYRETKLRGATRTGGLGEIQGDDGATHSGGSQAGGLLEGLRIGRGGVQIDDGNHSVSIGRGGVVVDDGNDTVSVRGTSEGLRVETGDTAVTIDTDVVVDGDVVRLGVGGTIEISGDWRDAGRSSYGSADTERLLIELGASEENGELHIGLAGDVLFDVDSAAIQAAGAAELRKLAHVLRRRAGGEIRLVGHTDSLGTDDHNQKLSQERALAVMRWLHREEGIPAELMVGQGMGSKKPIAYNTLPDGRDNPDGRARNRRVEIFVATGS